MNHQSEPESSQAIQAETSSRGRLKIFLAAASGAGKTFAMLEQACLKKSAGIDVVAGFVETRGQAETEAMLKGFEILPPKILPFEGELHPVFDLDGALARRPQLILVDDLASTNTMGTKHAKRWQDVWDLLDAGIGVYTTVNVQHIESLKDVVSQITGVPVRETIPDSIFGRADEVELVDASPEELIQRLQEGRIRMPDSTKHLFDRFFRKGNLLALRELALRRTAEHVDGAMRQYMAEKQIDRTWATVERFLVWVEPEPRSANLIRATRRLAANLNATWIAAHLETIRRPRYSQQEQSQLEDNLRLAERLGAETVVLQGDRTLAEDLIALARSRNVTRIIVGKPSGGWWSRRLADNLIDELVQKSGDVDLMVLTGESEEAQALPRRSLAWMGPIPWRGYIWTLFLVAMAAGLSLFMQGHFDLADIVMVYLLAILISASRFGLGPSLAASVLSVGLLAVLNVEPLFTFAVQDHRHWGTFAIMLATGLVIGNLHERLRAHAQLARFREQRTLALFKLAGELARTARTVPQVEGAVQAAATQFQAEAWLFLPDEDGQLIPPASMTLTQEECSGAQWVLDHNEPAGLGTDHLPHLRLFMIPLVGSKGPIGVLGLLPEAQSRWSEPDQRHLLETFANQTALALERARMAEEKAQARSEADQEHLRNALLSSVSQDLQLPLQRIGQAESLLREYPDATERDNWLKIIHQETLRLRQLIRNFIDLSRLETGGLSLHRETMDLKLVFQAALERCQDLLQERNLKLDWDEHLPFVEIDSRLMEQVFVNLLDNALKYSPEGSPVDIKAWATEKALTVSISDHGPGLPEGMEEKIFEKLVRFEVNHVRPGAGLGLPVCRGILLAHGGKIWAANGAKGGSQFYLSLPLAPNQEMTTRSSN